MIRNIIYYSDDFGFTDKVIEYANYELMVDEFSSDFDQFDIANTLNGVACTLLKIQDGFGMGGDERISFLSGCAGGR